MRGFLTAALAAALAASSAHAGANLDTERALADLVATPEILASTGGEPRAQSRALLPIVGYSPEQGPVGGVKLVDRDRAPAHLAIDVEALRAFEGQQEYSASVGAPSLGSNQLLGLLEARFFRDPTHEFFGLGNDGGRGNPLSTHEIRWVTTLATLGIRGGPHWTAALTAGFHRTDVGRGRLERNRPATVERFGDLAGIHGGRTSPISVSFVYDDRDDLTRPTCGWNLVAKLQSVNRWLGNDFRYTRTVVDGSYLRPFPSRRQILAVHVGGELIDGNRPDIPFFELASLGGSQDLRGYFRDRFLGRGRVIAGGEYRVRATDLDLPLAGRVGIDVVPFVDAGRVFGEGSGASFTGLHPSFGAGLRFALGEALLVRLDAGFSREESGLVYLDFDQPF